MYNRRAYGLLTRRGYVPGQDFNVRKLPNGDFDVEWLIPDGGAPTQQALELEAKRDEKASEIKSEGLRRARQVYDTIGGLDDIRLIQDILQAAGVTSLSGRLQRLRNIRQAGVDAIQTVRLLKGDALDQYDAINDPSWP